MTLIHDQFNSVDCDGCGVGSDDDRDGDGDNDSDDNDDEYWLLLTSDDESKPYYSFISLYSSHKCHLWKLFWYLEYQITTTSIYRGYFTVARRYEVYLRVEKIVFSREDKLHIFKPTCNFFSYRIDMSVSKIKKKN